jgi:hypothetical protein
MHSEFDEQGSIASIMQQTTTEAATTEGFRSEMAKITRQADKRRVSASDMAQLHPQQRAVTTTNSSHQSEGSILYT